MVIERLYEFDFRYRREYDSVCGVDEAGRGPLAGPVCCAACVLPEGLRIDGLDDSKKLSEKKREALFEEIKSSALAYSVVFIDNDEIDRLNILAATMKGMAMAVEQLPQTPGIVLIDGNRVPENLANALPVVKGDASSASIAAASVLAKVSRDRLMLHYAEIYPEYGFQRHKGYPTRQHYEAIDSFGILPIHRKSFLKGRI